MSCVGFFTQRHRNRLKGYEKRVELNIVSSELNWVIHAMHWQKKKIQHISNKQTQRKVSQINILLTMFLTSVQFLMFFWYLVVVAFDSTHIFNTFDTKHNNTHFFHDSGNECYEFFGPEKQKNTRNKRQVCAWQDTQRESDSSLALINKYLLMMINVFFLLTISCFVEKFGTHRKDGIDIMNNIVCDLMKIVLIKVVFEKNVFFEKNMWNFSLWRT